MSPRPSRPIQHRTGAPRLPRAIVVFGVLLALIPSVLTPSALTAQARTVLNRGFERPTISSDWQPVPDANVPGWTSPDGIIEIWRSGFNDVPAFAGGQFAEANANSPSGFWQDVCLLAGESVPWSFQHRGRSGVDSMRVTIAGAEVARVGTGTGAWVRYSGTFVAPTSGPARVRFSPLDGGSVGNLVDELIVDLVPHVEVGPDATVPEGSGVGAVLLVSGTLTSARTVDVVVTGGSATAGTDYSVTSTVTIPAGTYDGTPASGVPLDLGVQDDGVAEGDETLVYELANPSTGLRRAAADAAACGSPGRSASTVTIIDSGDASTADVDLEIEKSGPDEDVQAGVDVTYEIEVENKGPDNATAVVVTDTLPAGATFVSATRGATESGGVVTWPAISLADGETLIDEITLRFGRGGTQLQIAAVTSASPDSDPDDNRDEVEVEDVCGFAVTTVSTMSELRGAVEDECVQTIRLRPGTYLLSADGEGELRIEDDKQLLNAGGGAVVIDGGGASRVFRIDDNTVTLFDGLEVVGGAVTGGDDGGAFRTDGDVTIRNTLIAGNSAEDNGGGLFQSGGQLLIENVTVTQNTADGNAGGLSVRSNAILRHVTVAGNTSTDEGSGIDRRGGGDGPRLENVLVADNVGPGDQVRRAIRPSGVNLVEGGCAGCRPGTDLTGDPGLLPLTQNGGLTRTLTLSAGSTALDVATDVLATDQRGVARPEGGSSDIGAFERVVAPPAVTVTADVPTASRLPSNGVAYEAVFTVTNAGGTAAAYDLFATSSAPTVSVDSIRGTGLGFDTARPDSARTPSLGAGASRTVSVWYSVGDVSPGQTSPVVLSAVDVSAPAIDDEDEVAVTVVRPSLGLSKTALVAGKTVPGVLITYKMTVTNAGTEDATSVVLSDSIPGELVFQVGSASAALPGGVSSTVEFASTPGGWGYLPTSGGCGADPGFDACVRFVRWTLTAPLPAQSGTNSGQFSFSSVIR